MGIVGKGASRSEFGRLGYCRPRAIRALEWFLLSGCRCSSAVLWRHGPRHFYEFRYVLCVARKGQTQLLCCSCWLQIWFSASRWPTRGMQHVRSYSRYHGTVSMRKILDLIWNQVGSDEALAYVKQKNIARYADISCTSGPSSRSRLHKLPAAAGEDSHIFLGT